MSSEISTIVARQAAEAIALRRDNARLRQALRQGLQLHDVLGEGWQDAASERDRLSLLLSGETHQRQEAQAEAGERLTEAVNLQQRIRTLKDDLRVERLSTESLADKLEAVRVEADKLRRQVAGLEERLKQVDGDMGLELVPPEPPKNGGVR